MNLLNKDGIGIISGREKVVIDKPIRLIELFAGIGCQAQALKHLGVEFEHYRVCEIDKYAVKSYNALHSTNFETSDVCKLNGSDLGIVDTNKYCYIMTYSFPCTDLSLAGKGQGMKKGSGTRSGLLWEVERLLKECKELPQVLLMENVPQVHGKKNIDSFNEWCAFLESKGYKNYWKDLNAKNYGIPQNRNRTFMVSLLGDYCYEFPEPFELKLRLRDMLESEVDEKYYLSDKALNGLKNTTFECSKLENRTEKNGIIPTLCARDYKDPKLVKVAQLDGFESSGRVYSKEGLAPTINTMGGGNREPKIAIKNVKNLRHEDEVFSTLGTNCGSSTSAGGGVAVTNDLRIRKLTAKECWRLMGLTDEEFEKAKWYSKQESELILEKYKNHTNSKIHRQFAKEQRIERMSNSQLYKQAGNGIVVNVLMAIFKNLLKEK